jgi:hypothetical protein
VLAAQAATPLIGAPQTMWMGRWTGLYAEAELRGTYLAVWANVRGQWAIESELYVTLTGKDLPAMLGHVTHDELVGWGWDPGVGRAPVPVPRAELTAAFRTWMDAGAPCPAR